MSGRLYLCATPIGNLEDITFRVIRILKEVDLIAAEDTRNSIKLLNHFEIKTPMTSYHEHNKESKGDYLVSLLIEGKNIALVTDAGTPGISDPGEELVRKCHENGIVIESLPGAAACISALIVSGQKTRRFCFEAFLPTDKKERAFVLKELKEETRTIIIYEAPHRLLKLLKELEENFGNRGITICKELTKRYENVWKATLSQAIEKYENEKPLGEYVLVMEGASQEILQKEEQDRWREMSIEEHMALYEKKGMPQKEAMKAVAKDRGVTKRDIYQHLLDVKE